MATADIIVPELTRNQKAAARTDERRLHLQALRAEIQIITDEYRFAKRINQESYRDWLDAVPNSGEPAPEPPTHYHGKPPTTHDIYSYLCAHAEWEVRSGTGTRRALIANRDKLNTIALHEALEKIRAATDKAIHRAPESLVALRADLQRMGAMVCTKLHPVEETPAIGSSMLAEYGLEARIAMSRAIRTTDAGRPRLTPISDLIDDPDDPQSTAVRQHGRWVATSSESASGREFAMSQRGRSN